jgi:hypothetical protein
MNMLFFYLAHQILLIRRVHRMHFLLIKEVNRRSYNLMRVIKIMVCKYLYRMKKLKRYLQILYF